MTDIFGETEILAEKMSDGGHPNSYYAWYVIGVLFVASVFAMMDRQILSLLVIPMKRDLNASDTEISLLQGMAFALFHATMGLPIGRLSDRINRKNVIAVGILAWSVMTAVCGTVRSFWQLFLFRMGVGVGEAALAPAAYSIIPDYFDPVRLGLAMGVYGTGISIGSGLALILGAEIVNVLPRDGVDLPFIGHLFSWQLVFLAVGLPGILVAFWVWTLREPKRRGLLRTETTSNGQVHYAAVPVREVLAYIRANKRSYFGINLGYAFVAVAGYGSGAWIPTFLMRTHDFSAVQAGRWLGIIVVPTGTIGIVLGGLIGNWFIEHGYSNGRVITMSMAGILAAPFAIAYPLVSSVNLALALMVPSFLFTSFVTATWMASMPLMIPNQMRGLAMAFAILLNNLIGLGLGPTAIALVTDHVFKNEMDLRYSLSIVLGLALLLASGLCILAAGSYVQSLAYLERWNTKDQNSQVLSV